MATMPPNGIFEKMNGKVLNTRPGPSCGLSPKANTAGIIAQQAINANRRSKTAIETPDETMFSVFFT